MKNNMLVRWLPAVAWMVMIFLVSNTPADEIPQLGVWDLLVKKGAHFLAYALLAVLVWRGSKRWQGGWWWAVGITAVYAMTDEYHQTFVPGRHGNVWDVLIDTAGGLAGLYIRNWWGENRLRRAKRPSPVQQ
ncbi:MAG: VanZ family protein [Chloroflexi bacterium]|nr:MAG: VanZ family protein [Chloroflexota bacterium]